jgi:uncharacterized protein with von Willebrand factor type A (vWA) domain
VKDEHDRPTFDTLFDVAFPLVSGETGRAGKRRRRAGGGEPTLAGRGRGEGEGGRTPIRSEPHDAESRRAQTSEPRPDDGDRSRGSRRRALLRKPLHLLDPCEVEEARDLVRALAPRIRGRLARRERRRRRGRVDVRRMLRAATASGGVPLRIVRTHRRPDRGDLLALVDLSGSVATASELCLGLVAPAAGFFRRVHTFAYVDRLCPITIEHGHLTPDGRSTCMHDRTSARCSRTSSPGTRC